MLFAVVGCAVIAAMGFLGAGCGSSPSSASDLGLRALEQGRYPSAIRYLEKAVKESPQDASVLANLGIAYWKTKQPEKAINSFNRAALLAREDSRPVEFAAQVYGSLGRWPDAVSLLEEAYRRAPDSPRVLTALAAAQAQAGQVNQAKALLNQALSMKPDYAPALYNLGVISRDWLKNTDDAHGYFEKYLEIEGSGERAEQLRAELVGGPAAVPPKSARADGKAVSRKGGKADEAAAALLLQARKATQAESYDEALLKIRQAIDASPGYADAHWELARLYDKYLQDLRQAADTYRQFVMQFPDDTRSVDARARLDQLASGKRAADSAGTVSPAQVIPGGLQFQKLEQRDPQAAIQAYNRAVQYHRANDLERAVYYYTRSIEADDSSADAFFNLGLVYRAKGDMDKARQAFLYALSLKSDMQNARYMLALVYSDLNLDIKAIDHLTELLRVNPAYADAHLALGSIYQKDKNKQALAKQHFQKYLDLAPDGMAAADVRKWLASHAQVQTARAATH